METYTALDTETIRGKAFLLSSAKGVHGIRSFDDFLRAQRCYCEGKRKTACFTWFNLDYDVTGLLKHLDVKIIKHLFVKGWVKFGHVRLEYIPGKYLLVKHGAYTFRHYDVYAFFQSSLDSAAEKFLPEKIKKKKVSRSSLKSLSWRKYLKRKVYWDAYAMQDAKILQRLTDELVTALREIGHSSRNLYSPGYVAKHYLKRKQVSFGWLPPQFEKMIEKAYHGACVEIYQRGTFKKAWSYDLKSAYPAALASLPNFAKADYCFAKEQLAEHYFVRARVWMPEHEFYLLPVIQGNVVRFPRFTGQIAYMTNEEVDCLRKYGATVEPIEFVNVFLPLSEKSYAPIVDELFAKRKESGMRGLVYKLILNSVYGITAEKIRDYRKLSLYQTVKRLQVEESYLANQQFVINQSRRCPNARWYWMKNCKCDVCEDTRKIMRDAHGKGREVVRIDEDFYQVREFPGKMRNVAVAAKITAITRVRMYELKRQVERGTVIACFTDGLKTAKPIPNIELGTGLGDVALEIDGKPLVMVGCGVYEHGDVIKIRGFHYKKSLRELLQRQRTKRTIRIPSTSRLTGLELIHDKRAEIQDLNLIVDDSKSLNVNFDSKRSWPYNWANAGEMLCGHMISKPLDFGG